MDLAMTQEFLDRYKKHPIKFLEEVCGVKLSLYQKILLILTLKRKRIRNIYEI